MILSHLRKTTKMPAISMPQIAAENVHRVLLAQQKPAGMQATRVGPRGGVYMMSRNGKFHSIKGVRGSRRANELQHEGGLVHRLIHDCFGGLRHE